MEIAVLACGEDTNPEALAALTHQLRISPDHRDALELPVPLHLASLAAEYMLHAEGTGTVGTAMLCGQVHEDHAATITPEPGGRTSRGELAGHPFGKHWCAAPPNYSIHSARQAR
jgi:hypothetical protein